jgi:hypothetical protein
MDDIRVDFSGSEESIASLVAVADDQGVKHTGARDAGSNVEALNAPITGAEIILAAKVVTAVFKAGASVVAFIVAVRAALASGEAITIKLGKRKLTLTSDTPDETINKLAG